MAENTLRYTKLDYQSHRDAILQRIRARWPGVWNDYLFTGQTSFGTLIVDLVAWSAATTAWVVNRLAGENFISTMTLRESAQRIGALTGYKLRGPTPASVLCEAQMSTALDSDVVINSGTVIRASDDTVFEVSQDYTIEAGNLTPNELVGIFSATDTGSLVIATNLQATNGSTIVNLIDSTIDVADQLTENQTIVFRSHGTTYQITTLTSQGDDGVVNRLIITPAFNDGTESTSATIVEADVYETRILLAQGQTIIDQFVSPSAETTNYVVKLTQTPVIDNSIEVTVNGETWTEFSSIYLAGTDDKAFSVKTLVSGSTVVQFGDGTFGQVIPQEAQIEITYRIGGGTNGNVAIGQINTTISGFLTTTNGPATILVQNNSSEGQGGQDAETVEQARNSIPAYTRTNDRAVTLADYQSLASRYSGVAYARSAQRDINALLEGNQVIVYAWAQGSNGGLVPLSAPVKSALKTYLQSKAVGTDYVIVADGSDRPAPIAFRVKVLDAYDLATTKALVESTMTEMITSLSPGSSIIFSDLVRSVDEIKGVDNLQIATPLGDLVPANSEELFTPQDDSYEYTVDRSFLSTTYSEDDSANIQTYTAQLPVSPLAVWSIKLYIGEYQLSVIPDTEVGYARVYRAGVLSVSDNLKSRVHLQSGQITLQIKGAQGDLKLRLRSVQAYDKERVVNVYIGYTGTTSQAKRREIRSVLRNWADSLEIGGTLYGSEISGVVGSKANITAVVEAISGVSGVSRVALETPNSNDVKITAISNELLRLGHVVLNNQSD